MYSYICVTWSTEINHAVTSPVYYTAVHILSLAAAVWTNYFFYSASSSQVVFAKYLHEEGMSPDGFKLCLSIVLYDQVELPVEMYAIVTHVVPVSPEPDPAAILLRVGAIRSTKDVVLVQVVGGAG